jgi:hypothetical protein
LCHGNPSVAVEFSRGTDKQKTRGWRKLHNDKLHDLYLSPNTIRVITQEENLAGCVTCRGKKINAYCVSVGKPKGKRYLVRRRRRWEDNIKIELKEIRLESVDWIYLVQDRDKWPAFVNTDINLRVT